MHSAFIDEVLKNMGILFSATIRRFLFHDEHNEKIKGKHDVRKTSRANETTVYFSEDIAEGRVSGTVTNNCHLSHQSHLKSLKGIENKDFVVVVERLSKRYKISNDLKDRILEVKENESSRSEHRLEGENYCVVVVKHEDKLDIYLSKAVTQSN